MCIARYCYHKSSVYVCLSVRPSVTLMYAAHIFIARQILVNKVVCINNIIIVLNIKR